MNGARMLLQTLELEGIDTVFGLPGGANLPLYDALTDSRIHHILCRHEQGAGHAAEGYAKAKGKTGVVFATSGPGATNLVTAIADAMLDSVPVLFIVGQVRTELIGTDGFQEADAFGITMPVVKHSFLVHDVVDLENSIREALHIAATGRPGPVVMEIPQDILRAEVKSEPKDIDLPGYKPTVEGNGRQVQKAAQAILASERPILYTGGGALDAHQWVSRLADLGLPVTSTVMGLGTLTAQHPSWLGMPGMHGTRTANYALDQADLIIAVGARFDDRVTGKLSEFAPDSKIIHIDIDPAEISKNVAAHIPIVGDSQKILAELYALLNGQEIPRWQEWWSRIREWQQDHPLHYQAEEGVIKPQQAIEILADLTGGEAIIVSDVGQHQMWCAQYYPFQRPRQWINSGGLGTMGFGIPAGMGAQVGMPDQQVITVAGDGSAIMTAAELATLAEYDIPLKIMVINNGGYGMVRQWQEMFYNENYSQIFGGKTVKWPLLARALGVHGDQVKDPARLESSISAWLNHKGPALLEVVAAPEENCYPIIPPGAAARDMIG